MAVIELQGKYAVGDRRWAIVDDEDFTRLNRHTWRVRISRNTAYAVRSENRRVGGTRKCNQIQMHREVLGLTSRDRVETDHKNHNGLDNRKENLRTATKSENQKNRIWRERSGCCAACGEPFAYEGQVAKERLYCSRKCRGFAPDSLLTSTGQKKAARLLAALSNRMGTREISAAAHLHIVSVWRLLPQLVERGAVALVSKKPHLYERRA